MPGRHPSIRSKSNSLVTSWLPAYSKAILGDFELIETQTVGAGGAASVTFSSIPGTYKHLEIRYVARSARSATTQDLVNVRLNSDTGSNYSWHRVGGDGATASVDSGTTQTSMRFGGYVPAASSTASIFGASIIQILDYASTSKNRTMRGLGGHDQNGSGQISLYSGAWYNSSTAVNAISFVLDAGSNFVQYSSFSLYGCK